MPTNPASAPEIIAIMLLIIAASGFILIIHSYCDWLYTRNKNRIAGRNDELIYYVPEQSQLRVIDLSYKRMVALAKKTRQNRLTPRRQPS